MALTSLLLVTALGWTDPARPGLTASAWSAVGAPLQPGSAPGARVRISVSSSGIYRITGADLAKAGVQLAEIAPDRLAVSCQGQPVACRVSEITDGRFTEASTVIFHGEALDTRYTDTNVYWLTWRGEPGPRMGTLALPATVPGALTSLRSTVHLEENHEYVYLLSAPDTGELRPWFWQTINAGQAATVSFGLPHLAASDEGVRLRIMLRGRTANSGVTPGHHIVFQLNGQPIGEARFDGQAPYLATAEVPVGRLRPDGNALTLTVPGDTPTQDNDRVSLDWVEVEYPRSFDGGRGGLVINLPQSVGGTAKLTSIDAPTVDLYDVTNLALPTVAANLPAANGMLSLPVTAGPARTLAVVTSAGYETPGSIDLRRDPELQAAGAGADYLIIAHDSLLEAVKPLAEYRASQGLKVRTVPVTAVYDEFSGGVFTPEALKNFVAYTLEKWRPPPRYLLLVGDATYDYRDYQKTGFRNLVPSTMVREAGSIEVAADTAYVVGAEGKPLMAVGRLPARTPEETAGLVRRTIDFERQGGAGLPRKLRLVADQEGFGDAKDAFTARCDGLAQQAQEAGFAVERFYQTDVSLKEQDAAEERIRQTKAALTRKLLEALQSPARALFYAGHGDEYFWGYHHLLAAEDLRNVVIPQATGVIIEDTCFAGAFDCPGGQESISEALLCSGACVACYAPSRLGGGDVQTALLLRLLQGDKMPLGQLLLSLRGQRTLRLADGCWASGANFNLLGDPALRLNGASG